MSRSNGKEVKLNKGMAKTWEDYWVALAAEKQRHSGWLVRTLLQDGMEEEEAKKVSHRVLGQCDICGAWIDVAWRQTCIRCRIDSALLVAEHGHASFDPAAYYGAKFGDGNGELLGTSCLEEDHPECEEGRCYFGEYRAVLVARYDEAICALRKAASAVAPRSSP